MKILETERLLMRRLVASDLDDLYALYRDLYPSTAGTVHALAERQER